MALYKDGNPVSGLNSIPRLTLAQYNALNVKPEFWVRTDAPESYKKLSADQVSYDENTTVKDKFDGLVLLKTVSVSANSDVYLSGFPTNYVPVNIRCYDTGYHYSYDVAQIIKDGLQVVYNQNNIRFVNGTSRAYEITVYYMVI